MTKGVLHHEPAQEVDKYIIGPRPIYFQVPTYVIETMEETNLDANK